ncbi:hypothetical protein ElyMa_006844000 [Elysia marginata]|uniref:Reverse transcriptase zinc-binding domain-containing protein n=1 Tax=Elysia marginata TaxID=1093978 RepID=A0AAV4J683_9GAST|nr:hypothetical protein ElyMa_006844000 [Elysia marginata]
MEKVSDSVNVGVDMSTSASIYNDTALVEDAGENEYVQVLSDYGRLVFEIINYVTISSVIGLFGIFSNIVNIIIFIKTHWDKTTNRLRTRHAKTDFTMHKWNLKGSPMCQRCSKAPELTDHTVFNCQVTKLDGEYIQQSMMLMKI